MSGVGEGRSKFNKHPDYDDNYDAIFRKKDKTKDMVKCKNITCGKEYTEQEAQKLIDCPECCKEFD